jgi:membrane protease subunit (stomatin/prohibitin family)
MNMITNEKQVSLLEREAAARLMLAQARQLELQNELTQLELEEKRAALKMQEAERISASTYAKQSPADVYYAWRAMGEPRGLNMAQTLQNAHIMRGGKLSEHAALQWGDVERSGLLEDLRVVEQRQCGGARHQAARALTPAHQLDYAGCSARGPRQQQHLAPVPCPDARGAR